MSAFGAIQELIWLKGVLSEIGIHLVDPITLNMDAKSAIALERILCTTNAASTSISSITG